MRARFPRPWPLLLLLGAGLLVQTSLRGQDPAPADDAPPPVPQGVEVLARGPVHEAFAELTAEAEPTKVVPKQPPKPLEEMPPEEKPDGDVSWIGGYWAWDDDRNDFLWVSGVWRSPPPGKQWVAGYWRPEGDGAQWVPGFWTPTAKDDAPQDVTYLPRPPEPPKLAPPAAPPSADVFYVPGHWEWKEGSYRWYSGYWARVQPNYVWVPGHFRWTPGGYIYLAGYWDYTVRRRGVLFAPVVVDPNVVVAGYVYTPAYAVPDDVVVDALFVRPSTCHYYFGDYYDASYRDSGFVSCVVYSRDHYDSIVVHERYEHRDDPTWINVQINLSNDRYAGRAPVPPRTLNQQTTIINNTTVVNNITNNTTNIVHNNTTNNRTVNRLVMKTPVLVAPSRAIAANGGKVVKLNAETRQTVFRQSTAVQQAAAQRTRAEIPSPGGPPKQPRVASLNLPKAPSVGPKGVAPVHNAISPTTGNPTTRPAVKPVQPAVKPTTPVYPSHLTPSAPPTRPVTPATVTPKPAPSPFDPPHAPPGKPTVPGQPPGPGVTPGHPPGGPTAPPPGRRPPPPQKDKDKDKDKDKNQQH